MSSSSALRMSGMNSGFDTESIVKALTATTKNKINTNNRKVLKLKAQQEAYRSVITSMTDFKNKYFDVLNSGTYLKSSTLFNKYNSTLSNAAGTNVKGVTTSSNSFATPASYNVKINNVATQATYKTAGTTGSAVDISACTDSAATYAMQVSVNGTTKNITFTGGDAATVRDNINSQLSVFGTTNSGGNIVNFGSDNKFTSTNQSTVASSAASVYTSTQTLDISSFATGSNTFNVTVGDETKSVTFSTVANDYFDDILDADGNVLADADESKAALFEEAAVSLYNATAYDAYTSADQTTLDAVFDSHFAQVSQEQHDQYFELARRTIWSEAVTAGTLPSDSSDPNYVSVDDFVISEEDFQASSAYQTYLDVQYDREDYLANEYDSETEFEAYKEYGFGQTQDDFIASVTVQDRVDYINKANLENNLGALSFARGVNNIDVTLNGDGTATVSGLSVLNNPVNFSITQAASNATDFGVTDALRSSTTSQINTAMTLDELGLTADADGNYNFSINGVALSYAGTTKISEMMKNISSNADVNAKLTYTTLTNSFTLTSNEYGTSSSLTFGDDAQGLLNTLGFNGGSAYTAGENLNITVNGVEVETESNTYTVDGTSFTFASTSEGTEFDSVVARDYSTAIDAVKSFVEDYNKMIEEVYGYVDDEPDSDYYFLTDQDIEDLSLSETQQDKWEKASKKGILYNDSTLTSLMSKLRTTLYGSTTAADGSTIGLYTIGITTSDNWAEHGKLTIDEAALTKAFETYADEIGTLFSDATDGIMTKFDSVIDSAVKTTGARAEKGVLVQKAGVAATSSATDNSIYDQIKSLTTLISSLQERYDQQEERYWSIFSNMETQLGSINSQSSYINQLLGSQ